MKNFGLLILISLGTMTLTLPVLSAQALKGKWEGTSEGEMGMVEFDKQGYVTLVVGGEVIGGKKFEAEGLSMYMKYHTDNTREPYTIDFIMYMSDNTEIARMLGIYKLVDAKTLILNMDFDGIRRPEKFDAANPNQIELKKSK